MAKIVFCLVVFISTAWLIEATVAPVKPHCDYPTKPPPPPPPPKCGLYEVYSECGNNHCQTSCQHPQKSEDCKGSCKPGCICAENYYRNSKGVCVLLKDCDCKKSNESFNVCGSSCFNTCEEPNRLAAMSCSTACIPGCYCDRTYLRDKNGDCVPQSKCYKCNQPNEVFSECGNDSCQKNCDTYDLNIPCKPNCNPGCICKEGFIRNKKGVCVTPDQCENRQCKGKNEVFSKCVAPCGERCSNLGQDLVCNLDACKVGCDCKPGYLRNSKNECVLIAECDCGKNEELDLCFKKCPPRTCDSIGKAIKCPAPDPNCKPGCKCAFNFRRNSKGVCIPIRECPPLTCTRENEVYDSCPPSCLDERCKGLVDPLVCTQEVRECAPQCVCKDGFLRNDEGKCIPKTKCREYCSDPNAEFTKCGNVCPITCLNKDKQVNCPKNCISGGGCVCKKGYVEDDKKQCIPPEKCPKDPACGPYEIFSKVAPVVQETCATLGKNVCKDYKPGCVCVDGYVRECANGKCIKVCDCKKRRK